jgi:hypothetical protein
MHRVTLALIVLASWLARAALAVIGGQFYGPDEVRYCRSAQLLYLLSRGDVSAFFWSIVRYVDHPLYPLAGLIPAAAQRLYAHLLGYESSAATTLRTMWVAASVFALASAANILLVYLLALKVSGRRWEALGAAFLAACSNSLFYYASRFLPYDVSLALALSALLLGLGAPGARRSFACGVLAALSVLTYTGYWFLAPVVLWSHAFGKDWLRRGAAAAAGFAIPVALLVGLGQYYSGGSYLRNLGSFTSQVTQGEFGEGWLVPFAYLWHSEHLFILLLAAGAAAGLFMEPRGKALLWAGAAVTIYALLVLSSTVLHKFVVYGRLARAVVPFLCLAAAPALSGLWRRRRSAAALAITLVALQAGYNFSESFALGNPTALRNWAREKYAAADAGTLEAGWWRLWVEPGTQTCRFGRDETPPDLVSRYVLVNAGIPWPVTGAKEAPEGAVIFSVRHPFGYPPNQFEGYTPAERGLMKDLKIILIDRGAAPAAQDRPVQPPRQP